MEKNITLQKVYDKVSRIEERLARLEKKVVPEIRLGNREAKELERIRQEIRGGNTISEKELFSILSQ
ncbi:MAG TPA: hypothetical protein HA254_04515 [Candidatus Diapherotrites archaeon]|uniref:Uncharacterized protein n=1 Tax=Candidatus Iainarchaeum sp. TaxID=3101447 RepID=A0A7J4J3V4_9ARCH|nr:hypothetical protein [Candidatus Diapherotrites archaeon]